MNADGHLWIDSHCHLDAAEFADDRDTILATTQSAGISIVIPAIELANFEAVRNLTRQQNTRIYAAYGIHPMLTHRAKEADITALRTWLTTENPAAIGEIGLDGFVPGLDMRRQEWFFVEQLKLAREFDLPVILHVRHAQDQVLGHLRRIGVRRGIAHAFNGSHQQAEGYLKQGLKLGLGGAMTYTRASRIRALAATLPLDSFVLETDSPDIPPAWLPPKSRNSPDELPAIGATLAELRKENLATIADQINANTQSALNLEIKNP